jgi:hypothetical protein
MGLIKKAKAIKNFASNPAGAAGTFVGGAVAAAGHPLLAVAAAKGTERAVNAGIEKAKDPEVQAKVKQAAGSAVSAVKTRIDHLQHGIQESRGESNDD